MTREETIKILMVMQAAYPNYKPQDKTVAVNVWTEMLNDLPYSQVIAALKAYIQTDKTGFVPSIGEIRDKVQMLFCENEELNENESWTLVLKAIQNSTYHAEEEFEKLPPVIQRSVGSPKQLREWAMMENVDGKTLSVLQSNFQRVFQVEQNRAKSIKKLSPDLSKMIKEKPIPKIEKLNDSIETHFTPSEAPSDMYEQLKERWNQ